MSRTTISVNDLAEQLSIPAGTLRRYLRQHAHLLDVRKDSKSYVIAEESVSILRQIREGYSQGLNSDEVEHRLLGNNVQSEPANTTPSMNDHTYESLADALSDLEKLMEERFEQQAQLLRTLAEIAPALQGKPDPETQREERVNMRLNEWRIERKLQLEALGKWAELPKNERIMRTGLFKVEEDAEKRERFVREFVDKHFDDEMRGAYGV